MAANTPRPKLVVIVGPTASGKSELAMRVARQYKGEVIAADSRTIYKGMDIGTAKPSTSDQQAIKHWGLDLIAPDQQFSVKQFKDYARAAIDDIARRGQLPILVGGTGLYIDSIIFDYSFSASKKRSPINQRHALVPAKDRQKVPTEILAIGLDPGKEVLAERVTQRVERMLSPAFSREVRKLQQKYPADLEAFKAPGYQPMLQYLDGKLTIEEVKKIFIQKDLKLAKKQRTWFKRNKFILWHQDITSAEHTITQVLNT